MSSGLSEKSDVIISASRRPERWKRALPGDLVIAGGGIAAAATALRLLEFGFHPLILASIRPGPGGNEAIPERAWQLLSFLGLGPVLKAAGGAVVQGFENHWDEATPMVQPGLFLHVDRNLLAGAAISEAVKKGAVIRKCKQLPKLTADPDAVRVTVDEEEGRFKAAIDATGRAAVWSRPLARRGNQVAEMFVSPPDPALLRSKLVRLAKGWAYRIGLPSSITVAILADRCASKKCIDESVAAKLGVSTSETKFAGRRSACAQWCAEPVQGRRLAVGDAALAYDPIAGQGIRFALASAFAAASVVHSWCSRPRESEVADQYYRELVASARRRHLSFLDELYGDGYGTRSTQPGSPAANELPSVVSFSAKVEPRGLNVDGSIVTGEAVILEDGNAVRWLGGFDLLTLRELAGQPAPVSKVINTLLSKGMSKQQAMSLVGWCLKESVLRADSRVLGLL